jgi:hypothetical protein
MAVDRMQVRSPVSIHFKPLLPFLTMHASASGSKSQWTGPEESAWKRNKKKGEGKKSSTKLNKSLEQRLNLSGS